MTALLEYFVLFTAKCELCQATIIITLATQAKLSWSGHCNVEIVTIYIVLPMREELLHIVQSTFCEVQSMSILGGSGGMSPQEMFVKISYSDMQFY